MTPRVKYFTVVPMPTIRQQLIVAGQRRVKARDEARRQKNIISGLVCLALTKGMTKVEICKLAQISRPTLDAMLKDTEEG